MGILYNLFVTMVITLISTELSSQFKPGPSNEGTDGNSSSGGSSSTRPLNATPLRTIPLRATPRPTGPSSLIITFGHPDPHGALAYENFSYPPDFQTKNELNGDFMPIPPRHPFLSLTTANGFCLGLLNHQLVFFGIHAEFDGKPHRFKIPVGGGRPVLMRPEEVKEFYDFRSFKK